MYLAVQELRAQREAARWVAIPQEDFRYIDVLLLFGHARCV